MASKPYWSWLFGSGKTIIPGYGEVPDEPAAGGGGNPIAQPPFGPKFESPGTDRTPLTDIADFGPPKTVDPTPEQMSLKTALDTLTNQLANTPGRLSTIFGGWQSGSANRTQPGTFSMPQTPEMKAMVPSLIPDFWGPR